MRNQQKAARLAAAAFQNACRLHRDSVLLYRHGRYPSAFQLSVLAQEEVGKTFRLEEFIFRVRVGEHDPDEAWPELLGDLLSHRQKQSWFTRQEFDRVFPRGAGTSRVYRLMDDALTGRLERRKQDATLVGLSRDHRGKVDPRGRILRPDARIGERHAAEQLTRVGDVLAWLVEGYRRGVLVMDTADVEECLTRALESELHELWPTSPALRPTLRDGRSRPRVLPRVRRRTGRRGALSRAAQDGHRPVLRPHRLDRPRRDA